jgi:hypothetical protein
MGRYTIEELFATADVCTHRTQAIINQCPAYSSGEFRGFSSAEDMVDAIGACETYLQSEDVLCAVIYDPTYGYPREISHYMYAVLDGGSTISVKEFEIIEE